MMKQAGLRGSVLAGLMAVSATLIQANPAQAGGGCGIAPTNGSGTTVEMSEFCFGPTVLRVSPGARVTFINRDPAQHAVTGTAGRFGSTEAVVPGQSATYTFTSSGVYAYSCIFHPGMTGAIVVGDGTGPGLAQGADVVVQAPQPAALKAATPAAPVAPVTPWAWLAAALVGGLFAGFLLGRSRPPAVGKS